MSGCGSASFSRLRCPGGKVERSLILDQVRRGDLHILDRGFPSIDLFATFIGRQAFFVARLSSSWRLRPHKRRPLAAADHDAHIRSDWIVQVGKARFPIRVVHFRADGHDFRIATNLLEPAAWEIAELYKERWRVELLFRLVKSHLCRTVTVWDETACVDRLLALFLAALLINVLTGVVGRHNREPRARGLGKQVIAGSRSGPSHAWAMRWGRHSDAGCSGVAGKRRSGRLSGGKGKPANPCGMRVSRWWSGGGSNP